MALGIGSVLYVALVSSCAAIAGEVSLKPLAAGHQRNSCPPRGTFLGQK